jgi:hypothetical protein
MSRIVKGSDIAELEQSIATMRDAGRTKVPVSIELLAALIAIARAVNGIVDRSRAS